MGKSVRIEKDDDGRRLDRVLRKYLPGLPLSALHRLLRKGQVRLDGAKAKADQRVAAGSELSLPDSLDDDADRAARKAAVQEAPASKAPRAAPFRIVLENDDFLVVDKEAGMLVHGEGGLDRLAADYLEGRLPPSLSFKPGPLHRLDRGTSGLIVFSKSLAGARAFTAALREAHEGGNAGVRVLKRYLAVLDGILAGTERWEDELARDEAGLRSGRAEGGGDRAVSEARPLAAAGGSTLAEVTIATGRTHQIRAQAALHGHPLAGDRKYGGSPLSGGFLLHAYLLEAQGGGPLPPPLGAPPPPAFKAFVLERFGNAGKNALDRLLPTQRDPAEIE